MARYYASYPEIVLNVQADSPVDLHFCRRELTNRLPGERSPTVLWPFGRIGLACRPMLGASQAINCILQFVHAGRHPHAISAIVGNAFGYVIVSNRGGVSRKVSAIEAVCTVQAK